MTLFLCLDDRNGMRFNNRRQSRDRSVLEDIAAQLTAPLFIDSLSERMIARHEIPYAIAPEDASQLPEQAQYFVEFRDPALFLKRADRVVLYRWNRLYPADTYLEVSLLEEGFSLIETREFPGHSHETITREVYAK